jgi:site-specific DNA recombinase
VTLRQIAKRLTQSAISAPRGGNRWGSSTINRIVRNEAYIGTLYYNRGQHTQVMAPLNGDGSPCVPKKKVTLRPHEEWISVSIPAIITSETFTRSLARHEPNRRFSPRRLKEERWLLRRLLRCARCGYKHVCVGGQKRSDGQQRSYCYRCGRSDGLSDRPHCRPSITHAAPLDELVWQTVCQHLLNPEWLVRARSELATDVPLEESFLAEQLQGAQRRLRQAKARRKNNFVFYLGLMV